MGKEDREVKQDVPAKRPEQDPLMGLKEFALTNHIRPTAFAGFSRYCSIGKVPPRMSAKQWDVAFKNWLALPVQV